MPRKVMIEEFHVSLHVPRHLAAQDETAIRRTLRSPSFERRLRQAVEDVVATGPRLGAVVVTVSR